VAHSEERDKPVVSAACAAGNRGGQADFQIGKVSAAAPELSGLSRPAGRDTADLENLRYEKRVKYPG